MRLTIYRRCFVALITSILISGCTILSDAPVMAEQSKKTAQKENQSYRLGRFSIEVPKNIKQAIVKYVVDYAEIDEVPWLDQNNHILEREKEWSARLKTINNMTPPEGVEQIIIGEKDFTVNGIWSKGIAYRGDPKFKQVTTWHVLIDTGLLGVWINIDGTDDNNEKLVQAIKNIVGSYRSPVNNISNTVSIKEGPGFYLQYGALDLPFQFDERVYTRFEGHPLDQYLKLKVEMNVVEEIEETNLIQRLSIALVGNFAPGVSIDQIRSDQREVAGLKGDEVILRGTESDDSNLIFSWRFPGEKDSATAPEILIKMDSKDGDLDEKLELWDSILNSFKPLGH